MAAARSRRSPTDESGENKGALDDFPLLEVEGDLSRESEYQRRVANLIGLLFGRSSACQSFCYPQLRLVRFCFRLFAAVFIIAADASWSGIGRDVSFTSAPEFCSHACALVGTGYSPGVTSESPRPLPSLCVILSKSLKTALKRGLSRFVSPSTRPSELISIHLRFLLPGLYCSRPQPNLLASLVWPT